MSDDTALILMFKAGGGGRRGGGGGTPMSGRGQSLLSWFSRLGTMCVGGARHHVSKYIL